ncbi:unnamed protein product [Leptidea sinapis]|uniref:Gem-associated protein 8 n=1 Tax=Leptidea sinapis TaxID=189913 RepID=A0A5E4PSP1_9NEOP|nr:unnamed protein product [Leptidea sinapis]
MSTLVEDYSIVSTWQIKHELAYWKARAKALEYENKFLHNIIKNNHFATYSSENICSEQFSVVSQNSETNSETDDESEQESESANDENLEDELYDGNFEVSEEFLQFLATNAKFKEDARKERERLKVEEEANELQEDAVDSKYYMTIDQYKKMYGDQWQKICALEMSMETAFIHKFDQFNPSYWPNMPFNFN